jgi:hypothetical protein
MTKGLSEMRKVLSLFVALGALWVSAGIAAPYGGNPQNSRGGNDSSRVGVIGVVGVAPTSMTAQSGLRMPTIGGGLTGGVGGVTGGTVSTPAAATTVAYSIENCMNDVQVCVEGALPKGIRAMFDAEMRNSVINGMNLCGSQVEKCIHESRRIDGKNAYSAKNEVWVDFNSRVIQPAYYAYVLRRTGLTPVQAQNTCLLIDKNVSGSSFGQVADYDVLDQLGSATNNDIGRGSYARWDATEGDCLVRVAAYNKDNLITNEWLFGIAGDKKPAEQWKSAGSSFSCKAATFEFNLMNNTQTAALVGIGGGTLVGAGAGAAIGAVAANAKEKLDAGECSKKNYRKLLADSLADFNDVPKDDLAGLEDNADKCREIVNKYKYGGTDTGYYTVSFNMNNVTKGNETLEVARLQDVRVPSDTGEVPSITPPKMEGNDFLGFWEAVTGLDPQYIQSNGTPVPGMKITKNITLYAGWSNDISDDSNMGTSVRKPKAPKLTGNSGNTATGGNNGIGNNGNTATGGSGNIGQGTEGQTEEQRNAAAARQQAMAEAYQRAVAAADAADREVENIEGQVRDTGAESRRLAEERSEINQKLIVARDAVEAATEEERPNLEEEVIRLEADFRSTNENAETVLRRHNDLEVELDQKKDEAARLRRDAEALRG